MIALTHCHNVTVGDIAILAAGHFGILATRIDNLTRAARCAATRKSKAGILTFRLSLYRRRRTATRVFREVHHAYRWPTGH